MNAGVSGVTAVTEDDDPPAASHLAESHPGGIASLADQWMRRRAPFAFVRGERLPAADVDLAAMRGQIVTRPPDPRPGMPQTRYSERLRGARKEFAGRSALCLLNALVIMNLRKSSYPPRAPQLFLRLWREEADTLLAELDGRWLISSIITFADHGETEADRRIGQSLNILFSLMKLYEAERLYSGLQAYEPFDATRRTTGSLPMGMPNFAIRTGDLEANLLVPLLHEAEAAPAAGRLATHLLDRLNRDPRGLFRRLALMRATLGAARDLDN